MSLSVRVEFERGASCFGAHCFLSGVYYDRRDDITSPKSVKRSFIVTNIFVEEGSYVRVWPAPA